jgi:hypothetical protein
MCFVFCLPLPLLAVSRFSNAFFLFFAEAAAEFVRSSPDRPLLCTTSPRLPFRDLLQIAISVKSCALRTSDALPKTESEPLI